MPVGSLHLLSLPEISLSEGEGSMKSALNTAFGAMTGTAIYSWLTSSPAEIDLQRTLWVGVITFLLLRLFQLVRR